MRNAPPDDATSARLTAGLVMRAVLPVFGPLTLLDPEASALCAGRSFAFHLAVSGCDETATIRCTGTPAVLEVGSDSPPSSGALHLWFPGPRSFVRVFLQDRPGWVVPTSGWHQIGGLLAFQRIGRRMRALLHASDPRSLPPAERDIHVLLLFHTALGGAAWLASRGHLEGWKPGGKGCSRAWFRPVPCLPGLLADLASGTVVLADQADDADLSLEFADSALALDFLERRADEWAAIGLGQLRIRGYLPLADTLDAAMKTTDRYLRGTENR